MSGRKRQPVLSLDEHRELAARLAALDAELDGLIAGLARPGLRSAYNTLIRAHQQVGNAQAMLRGQARADHGEEAARAYFPGPEPLDWPHLWSIADLSARLEDAP